MEQRTRKRLRIQGFNYKSAGYYFVTFCTENRLCLFGQIIENQIYLNEPGEIIYKSISTLKNRYCNVDVDSFVVMPNHVHAIIVLDRYDRTQNTMNFDVGIPDIIRNIKTFTTTSYIKGVNQKNWTPFYKRLWQKSYHEHVIRNEQSLENIRLYIIQNPEKWEFDKDNPSNEICY
jgi:REP element-mobilizing transposase RayT